MLNPKFRKGKGFQMARAGLVLYSEMWRWLWVGLRDKTCHLELSDWFGFSSATPGLAHQKIHQTAFFLCRPSIMFY